MKIPYPSREFDDAVADICHGRASDEQMQALNELLRGSAPARDEYILRLELHARLASEPELFVSAASGVPAIAPGRFVPRQGDLPPTPTRFPMRRKVVWAVALAASLVLLAAGVGVWRRAGSPARVAATSKAVAMLSQTADVRWTGPGDGPALGAPLEPGWLRLQQGLAQIVFYSGARVVVEGPAEIKIVSPTQAFFQRGRITAEVPPQARGFRIDTPQGKVTDLGTAFGLDVNDQQTQLHVFTGEVTLQTDSAPHDDHLYEGSGAVLEASRTPRHIAASRASFAPLFDVQAKSSALEAVRLGLWRKEGERLNHDRALLVRFDFDDAQPSQWQLQNKSAQRATTGDATIVGCQWGGGRWTGKRALEFQNVSDRVRLNIPGDFETLTIATWVRVQGLDRQLNSLFMGDGLSGGGVHWLIRNDGALGVTVVGDVPGKYQIVTSPPVLTVDKLGMWLHLAVVIDGRAGRVTQYVNGRRVDESSLRIKPPYHIGTAELGNWNPKGFPGNDSMMIRNFSGAMDEFCLFSRAFDAEQIHALYSQGRQDAEAVAIRE